MRSDRRIRPAHRLRIIGIDQQQFACPDAGEMHLVGVDQKAAAVRIDSDRKMIGHGFMHPEPRRPAELAGEIDAFSVERQMAGGVGRQRSKVQGGILRLAMPGSVENGFPPGTAATRFAAA